MEKIKVLVIPSDKTGGVGFFRSIEPHTFLEKLYPDEFRIDIRFVEEFEPNESYLKDYQIVHFHRTATHYERMDEFFRVCQKLGIVTIMDLDDYWTPPHTHPAHNLVRQHGLDKLIIDNLKKVDYVTTTTKTFANIIRPINKNVFVIPNAINSESEQFKTKTEESDKIRIGYLCGSSHLHDIKLMSSISRIPQEYKNTQLVLCGFDLRGTVKEINKDTGETRERTIKPMETVWYEYEKVFTDNYKNCSPQYKTFLNKFIKDDFNQWNNENYRRVWTKPISNYASNYNLFDISLAPLVDNIFNKVKSNLKVVEAGFHKKVLIAQNLEPYNEDIIDGVNGFLIDSTKNHKDWNKKLKLLINNPEKIKEMGENLYETVQKYEIREVSKTRRELYLSLVNKKKLVEV
jgi:glycosyltransferase involved in cell wall biosynthesis